MDNTAPKKARAFLRETLCSHHDPEFRDKAELMVSELVTNAVVHGGSPITMEVSCNDKDGLMVRVSDESSKVPILNQAKDMDDHGRGVALVDLLSDDWGVEKSTPGKSVWFRLI